MAQRLTLWIGDKYNSMRLLNILTFLRYGALFWASLNGHDQVVDILLKNGAKIDVTAVTVASEYGHEKIINLLSKYGADSNKA